MTWPDYLAVLAIHSIVMGSILAIRCFQKSEPGPPCDCSACVDNSLELVERDTEKARIRQ